MNRSTPAASILSPWFLISVLLLLINDHLLKDLYGNWVTGKLSDVAGPEHFERLPRPCGGGLFGRGGSDLTVEQEEGRRTVRSTFESEFIEALELRLRPPAGRVGTPD